MCKIKRISAVFIAIVMASLLLCTTGCKKSSGQGDLSGKDDIATESTEKPDDVTVKAGGVINISVGPYDSFNPLKTSNEDIRVYTGLIYEDLVNINAVMEPVPNIFENWVSSEDFKIW
jgi:ABC-type oligopeptide transport system substrate-binding subunit